MDKRSVISLVVFIALIALGGAAYSQRYELYDWYRLRDYTPSPLVESLATKASLNDYGKRLFYVNDPQVQGRDSFNANCDLNHEGLILGCYDGLRIYIYDVTEEVLENVEHVTAAHEMLHAAYSRLSNAEKTRVNNLLVAQYDQLTNQRLLDIVELYRRRDPTVLNNELHSIIGTEVSDISPELEEYYSQYFVDRQQVVASAKEYEAVFVELEEQIENLESQLESLSQQISVLEADLSSQRGAIERERAELDALLAAERYQEYNSRVPGFNQQVAAYNDGVSQVASLIERYNATLQVYRDTAFQQNEYVNNLNSNFQPI